MGLRLKNFNTMGFHCKTQFLGGDTSKNQLPKKGGLDTQGGLQI